MASLPSSSPQHQRFLATLAARAGSAPKATAPASTSPTMLPTANPAADPDEMLDLGAVARLFGVSTRTLSTWEDLPVFEMGRTVRVRRGDLLAFVARHQRKQNGPPPSSDTTLPPDSPRTPAGDSHGKPGE